MPRRSPTAASLALAGALLAPGMLAGARPAAALVVELPAVRLDAGRLWVDVRLEDLFPDPVRETLERGMPATLRLHNELWRRRDGWFDSHVSSFDSEIRIQYQAYESAYRVERVGGETFMLASLDSVRRLLAGPVTMQVERAQRLQRNARYFVVVEARLQPLRVEDVEQLEGWLSGEAGSRGSGIGVITGLPQTLFDTVRNLSGFGDQRARAVTPDFRPATLAR